MIEWGLFGLFGLTFLASTIIPLPSEAAVLLFLTQDSFHPGLVILIATLGNSLGGSTNYILGFYSHKWMKKNHLKSEQLVQKYGIWTALLSWLPIIGDPLLVVLGWYRTAPFLTMVLMCVGKLARYLFLYWMLILAQG